MVRLAKLVLVGAIYAAALASVQTVGEEASRGNVARQADRLDRHGRRVGQDHQASPAKARAATQAETPKDGCVDAVICRQGFCKKNYLIFLTADWCGPCRKMHPIIDELAEDYAVYTLNVDANPGVVEKLKASALPTMIVMDKGAEIARFVGITTKAEIAKRMKTRKSQTINYEFDHGNDRQLRASSVPGPR